MISAAFPYKKQRRRVLGRQMAYVDVGQGDPIELWLLYNELEKAGVPTDALATTMMVAGGLSPRR